MRPSTWPRAHTGCAASASSNPRTPCLSLIEVPRLTSDQLAALTVYGERWSQLREAITPCDRQAAEDGVVKAYAAAGLPPPRDVVWAGGPFEIAKAWARSRGA